MAFTTKDHAEILDQLQSQLNHVLEQTGRVFAALNTNPGERPVAQTTKLKHILPTATSIFHEALDQFEDEIQLAMVVMRRDLAVCKEKTGQQAPAKPDQSPPQDHTQPLPTEEEETQESTIPQQLDKVSTPGSAPEPTQPTPAPAEDVVMEDVQDVKPSLPEQPPEPDSKQSEQAPAPIKVEQPHGLPLPDAKPATEDAKPSSNGLQLEIQPSIEQKDHENPPTDDEKAPDTAVDTVNDLDSLFNDPMSAGGVATENPDFNFDQQDGGDIDFGSFGDNFDGDNNDNDNISSLLPGLEDYANTQSNSNNGDLDLEQLLNLTGEDATSDNAMDTQGAGEQRDTTFDDLLNMAGFSGEGMEEDGNGSAQNSNNNDFDFDSYFN